MAYTTIKKPTDYFNTLLYTGNGSAGNKTGISFQPDWTWIKKRTNDIESHALFDAVRGVSSPKLLSSNGPDAQETHGNNGYVSGFVNGGFTVATNGSNSEKYEYLNTSGDTYASWNWKSETGVSGTTTGSGSARSYSGRVNTTAGISIINYAGNSTSGHTIPHHLGATPKMIIIKNMGDSGDWIIHVGALNDPEKVLSLNSSAAGTNFNAGFNTTNPTSSVFTLGNSATVNDDNQQYIAYSFAEKTGYSKVGKYTGNGDADGPFIYLGFKPAFIMLKKSSAVGDWYIFDNKREGYNELNDYLYPNTTSTEVSNVRLNLLSNGFKLTTSHADFNNAATDYIYIAFAEEPLVGDNPATAR